MENAVKRKLSPKVVLLIAIALIALFVAALAYQPNEKEPPKPKVDITVTLKNIVETSDLSTSVFKYEGIVEVPDPKKPKNIDYYICYSAEVYAGIDFSEVQFIEDKDKKTITAKLPEVKILDTVVDPNKLDFLFMDKKANNDGYRVNCLRNRYSAGVHVGKCTFRNGSNKCNKCGKGIGRTCC